MYLKNLFLNIRSLLFSSPKKGRHGNKKKQNIKNIIITTITVSLAATVGLIVLPANASDVTYKNGVC